MSDKNIQMKYHNGVSWDNLYPRTLSEIIIMKDNKTLEQAHDELLDNLDDKVDKETGKTLTTNDFTNTYKQKLESLQDHTQDVQNLQANKADKTNVYTKQEVDSKIAHAATGIPVSPDEPTDDVDIWFEELI